MKKFVSVLLAVVAAVGLCFGVAGCKESSNLQIVISDKTAEKPYFDIDNLENTKYKELNYREKYKDYAGEEERTEFDFFIDYYNNDFKKLCKNKFCLLNPNYGEELMPLEAQQRFNVFAEEITENSVTNPVIDSYFNIYDKELGSWTDKLEETEPGQYPLSVSMSLISVPIKTKISDKIVLEFGEGGLSDKYMYTKYINLYSGEECIGTCYYYEAVDVPVEWIKNYFNENMFFNWK